jgi:hypothetical protein
MTDPITAAVIVGLATSKFAEGIAGKGAEKLVEQLWEAIASRFKGRKKAEEVLAQLETTQGKVPEAEANLVRVLDAEMFEDDTFATELQQMAQQIINIQNQNQVQSNNQFNIDAKDNVRVNAIANLDATTVNFGDQK